MTTENTTAEKPADSWKKFNAGRNILAGLVVLLFGVVGYQAYSLNKAQEQLNQQKEPPKAEVQKKDRPTDFDSLFNDEFGAMNMPDPFQEMAHMRDRMDRIFAQAMHQFEGGPSSMPSAAVPQMDLKDEKDCYVLQMDLPGMDKNKLDVRVEDRTVKVSGTREEVTEDSDHGKIIRQERRSGHFERMLQLPGPVKDTGIEAKYENGVLTLTIPKAEEAAQSSQIRVL